MSPEQSRACGRLVAGAIIAALALFASVKGLHAQDRPKIVWEVANPLRFFGQPDAVRLHKAAYDALSAEERNHPILNVERALSRADAGGWARKFLKSACWDRARNKHRCRRGSANYARPKSHRIIVRAEGAAEASRKKCLWTFRYRLRRRHRPHVRTARASCDAKVSFDVPYPTGGRLTLLLPDLPAIEARIRVTDLFVVGLGDSFGSGEGNPDVPVEFSRERTAAYGQFGKQQLLSGYPARVGRWARIGDAVFRSKRAKWLDHACHRSLYSHQLRVALQLALEDPHRAVTFAGFACSGAEITKGLFQRYKGHEWVPSPPEMSQISAAAQAQCGSTRAPEKDYPEAFHMRGRVPDLQGNVVLRKCPRRAARKIDLILLSIGGNDIGFARLVANAVLRDKSVLKKLGGWFGQVYGKTDARAPLKQLRARYKALRRAFHNILHVPWSEADRIVLTAYPRMAFLDDGRRVCPSGRAGMEVMPVYALNSRRARDGEDIAAELNRIMRQTAHRFGWKYAERHRDAFIGRGICAGFANDAPDIADDLRFPLKVNGKWNPFNPADYQPYAPRKRWFRTPNDAYLTGNFHVTSGILRSVLRQKALLWTQVLLASTYSGAFHPTAEGHAAIADSVAEQARAVIAHYAN